MSADNEGANSAPSKSRIKELRAQIANARREIEELQRSREPETKAVIESCYHGGCPLCGTANTLSTRGATQVGKRIDEPYELPNRFYVRKGAHGTFVFGRLMKHNSMWRS